MSVLGHVACGPGGGNDNGHEHYSETDTKNDLLEELVITLLHEQLQSRVRGGG